ncbi:MED14-domain-containing protein [Ascobolus immersus RN42]|uniref:Mediator of RNA polymerase II transcription subunit 14 n=1 Tax=Ascobolus immersus RN42 TaxID=1160509 RepID=A0A3N4I4W7_ASCIM|nr:MED14-domain-containing protein [Ascobolus immersus RN42]
MNGTSEGKQKDRRPAKDDEAVVKAPPLPHITLGYHPLRLLVQRLKQDTFNRLGELIDEIQEGTEKDRKLKIINFMMERRQQWTKVLVLVMYAKKAQDLPGLIDLSSYFWHFKLTTDRFLSEMFRIRSDFVTAKVPNADLKTALEVLSKGSSSVPKTYGFLPPPPLSAAEILRTVRKINTLLAFRFSLHEIPPVHFRSYKIRSGKATFTVENEFEVDLSIGQEDHTSQLYLVDFRFLFTPTMDLEPLQRFRSAIINQGNTILLNKQLPGIYDFLHNLALTNKISVLAGQAGLLQEITGGRWAEAINCTMFKRTLRINYWIMSRADSKSWIDVGVLAPTEKLPSRLGVRWFRENKEVTDVEVPLDVANLSTERLLKSVIALHTRHILTNLHQSLSSLAIFPPHTLKLKIDELDSSNSVLSIQLTATRELSIAIEPITGKFVLKKPSTIISNAEASINSSSSISIYNLRDMIGNLRHRTLREEIVDRASKLDWECPPLRIIKPDDVKKWFGQDHKPRYIIYLRRKNWYKNWILAITMGDNGEQAWIVDLREVGGSHEIANVKIIALKTEKFGFSSLSHLEMVASATISNYVNCKELDDRNIQYTLKQSKGGESGIRRAHICIRTASIMRTDASWARDSLTLNYSNLTSNGEIRLVVQGGAKEPMTQLKMEDMSSSDSDIFFHPPSGSFGMNFVTKVGVGVIDQVIQRLQSIERLISFVSVIRQKNLSCQHVELGKIVFVYTTSPIRSATIQFSGEQLELIFPEGSPHVRVSTFLNDLLKKGGLTQVISQLKLTTSLLVALDEIEKKSPEGIVNITTRGLEWYRLYYPNTRNHIIDIRAFRRRSELVWFIKDGNIVRPQGQQDQPINPHDPAAYSPLRPFYVDDSTPGIEGLRSGSAVKAEMIGEALNRVHVILCPEYAQVLAAKSGG